MATEKVRKLRALLDSYESTGAFLADVAIAIESLYAETASECPDGFSGLDVAIEAFDAQEYRRGISWRARTNEREEEEE